MKPTAPETIDTLAPEKIRPMRMDAPGHIVARRMAVARELDARADAQAATIREAYEFGRDFARHDWVRVCRSLDSVRRDRAAAAALRRFELPID